MNAQYSLSKANHLIPLINAISEEIKERRAERDQLSRLEEDLEFASARVSPEGMEAALSDVRVKIRDLDWSLDSCRTELEALGLVVQRLSPLTVHIPGRTRSGDLTFCWEEGEDCIQHGHEHGQEDHPRRPLKIKGA
jgi:hypothetical protein